MIENMTRDEFIDYWNLEDDTIILEPWDDFKNGIIGVTDDKCHIVYGYNKLTEWLSNEYEKEWNEKEHLEDEEKPDFLLDAIEFIDYNTCKAIPHMNVEFRPIIIYEQE